MAGIEFKDFLEESTLFEMAKVKVDIGHEGGLSLAREKQPSFFCLLCDDHHEHEFVAHESALEPSGKLDLTYSCSQCFSAFKHFTLRLLNPRDALGYYDRGQAISVQKLKDSLSLRATKSSSGYRSAVVSDVQASNKACHTAEKSLDSQRSQ